MSESMTNKPVTISCHANTTDSKIIISCNRTHSLIENTRQSNPKIIKIKNKKSHAIDTKINSVNETT